MTSDDPPEPLTPEDCDLRGMPYMPLDIVRLFDSDLYILSNGDEFKAAVTLWGKAFLQVPAGSLPSDERLLAHLSGAKSWQRVRDMALRGWIKCADGRLYHRTVAEKALEAWRARQAQRDRTAAARSARAAARSDSTPAPPVTTSVTEIATTSVTEIATDDATGSKGREGKGRKKERKREPPLPSVVPPQPEPAEGTLRASGAPPPARQDRGSRIDPGWQPSLPDAAFAASLDLDPAAIAARFRDHWRAQPGLKGRKSDWSATWRNWCRREAEQPKARGQPVSKLAWLYAEQAAERPDFDLELPVGAVQ